MKTSLILILSLWISFQNSCFAQLDKVSDSQLFFCRANADMKNIVRLTDNTLIRPEKGEFIVLANNNGLITDTLIRNRKWGSVMGISVSNDTSVSVSYMNQGLVVAIENNKFFITEEIPANYLIDQYEMGMKTKVNNLIVGIKPNTNAPRKHSIYQYEMINPEDSQHVIINKPLILKSRYYEGMSHLADFQLYKKDNLLINHSEANTLLNFNMITYKTKFISFPKIDDKNKETWYAKIDRDTDKIYFIHNLKKSLNELYLYDKEENELKFLLKTEEKIIEIFKEKAYYRKIDDEKDTCFYFIDLNNKTNSKTEIIRLDEVIINKN
ncbi:hypothetical protein [Marivirga sp.]|uniref:hypothetical protein n=1 Tax=Marivirga sp. TaxID=2018662 RepID=UPI002D7EF775|nr:hypothetical protein [Marivirga sp.]HET8861337.1 hypothetical protein [Marivirga sp.]